MLPAKIAFVDVETTGSTPSSDRVIEVGILRTEGAEVVSTFKSLVNPESYVSPFIEEMTGIKSTELENAPTFGQIKDEILEILDECVFVAHNVRFDYGFLKNEFRRLEIPFSAKYFCTVKLSRFLFPRYRKHDLDSLIERFSFSCTNRHRAFDDAEVLWQFYKKIQKELPSEKFTAAIKWALRQPARPLNLSAEKIETLPEGPGVYIFHGAQESTDPSVTAYAPLYIGKSKNIKERVLSHFANDHGSATDMKLMQEVCDLEFIQTAGELGALLTESKLIKEYQPLYNRVLRNARGVTALVKEESKINTPERARLVTLSEINPISLENVLATFKSGKQARELLNSIAKEYCLCKKLLGLEKSRGACFGYQIGQCKGICIGEEKLAQYNLRFFEAFAKTKFRRWPFNGPISIIEENHETGAKQAFIIDKWCLVESSASSSPEEHPTKMAYKFDIDVYKIIRRFLSSPDNLNAIKSGGNVAATTLGADTF